MDVQAELLQIRHQLSLGNLVAAAFHCSRVLEFVARHAAATMIGSSSTNAYSNIEALLNHGVLTRPLGHEFHALRRLGNDVRHVIRAPTVAECRFALVWAERASAWWSTHGDAAAHGSAAGICNQLRLSRFALDDLLEDLGSGDSSPKQSLHALAVQLADAPVALAALLDDAMDWAENDVLQEVLAVARQRWPEMQRFLQLSAVVASRSGQLDLAMSMVEQALKLESNSESLGILGGVCKRRWIRSKARSELEDSYRAYRAGDEASGGQDVYTAINHAATAWWSGRVDDARRIARGVLDRTEPTLAHARQFTPSRAAASWLRLARAEAILLTGNRGEAVQAVSRGIEQGEIRRRHWLIARDQWTLYGGAGDLPAASVADEEPDSRK